MLTSARERLEVLKLKRAGKLKTSERNTASSQSDRKPGLSSTRTIQREIVPHTAVQLDENEKQVDYWKDVTTARDKFYFEREAREREANKKFREDQKRILDEHVALASARAVNKPEEDAKERAVVDQQYQDFMAERRRKKVKNIEHQHEIGLMRAEQVELKKKRQQQDREERRAFELRAVDRAKAALKQEQELLLMAREEAIKRQHEMAAENARLKQLKLQRKAKIDAEDAKALARMTEQLEKQASVSKAEFEAMKEKMRMRETIAFEQHTKWQEQSKADEERATKLTKQREDERAHREEEAARIAKEKTRKIKQEVKRQAEERAREREKIVKEKELEKVAAKIETESIKRIREEERARKLEKQRQVEEMLQQQMAEQRRKQTIVMSQVERKLNSGLLPSSVHVPDEKLAKLPLIR